VSDNDTVESGGADTQDTQDTSETLFERIIAREIPADIVYETDTTLAFRDIAPQAATHVLVVPKVRYRTVAELAAADPALLADVVATAAKVAEQEGLDSGYRLVFNTGADAGQTVFHVHAHVLGGEQLGQFGRSSQ
jgi:histidine triad (HIT) family protein